MFIAILAFQNNLYSNDLMKDIDDFGIISLMYHRFEENKYPSTNIKILDFKDHLEVIKKNNIKFINPANFEKELINKKKQRKVLLTIDDGFLSFYNNTVTFLPETKLLLIFPSYLTHHVYAFESDVTRISVSGNIKIMEQE